MNIYKYKRFFVLLLCVGFFLFFFKVFAIEKSVISLEGPDTVSVGDEFNLKVFISSQELLNAVDIEVNFSKEKVEFLSFNNASSIISLWQNNPTLFNGNKIKFSGGLFQAFSGNRGLLVSLRFKSINAGDINFSISKSDIYMADGKGTLSKALAKNLITTSRIKNSNVKEEVEVNNEDYSFDTSIPELIAEIVKSPTDHVNLISFNALDEESGVKQIQMRSKKWFKYNSWQEVANPVLYPKGAWAVEIKAINNQNLENIIKIHKYLNLIYKILIPILFLATLILFLVYNKGTHRQ